MTKYEENYIYIVCHSTWFFRGTNLYFSFFSLENKR